MRRAALWLNLATSLDSSAELLLGLHEFSLDGGVGVNRVVIPATTLACLGAICQKLDAQIFAPESEVRCRAKEGFAHCDKAHDVQNGVGCKKVKLEAIEMK